MEKKTKIEEADGQNVSVDNTEKRKHLIYTVSERPPVHITIVCALQQGLMVLASQLIVSLLVAEAVCASENNLLKARLLSSTLVMNGITTIAMNVIGVRLPLFQGAMADYVIPLLIIASIDGSFCSPLYTNEASTTAVANMTFAVNGTIGDGDHMARVMNNIQMLSGSLILAGFIHAMLGFTGLIGFLIRYIGPITIVPTILLLFVFIVKPVLKYVEASWPITMSTVGVAVFLFLYLSKWQMPIPVWTPSQGCRIIRYPLHQVFAILISILFNWGLCALLTHLGAFSSDPNEPSFNARTDARSEIIAENPWFMFPYPGQFGEFKFNSGAFLSCMIATLVSVLDSIGDYYACAKAARVPPPPRHAMNRGILVEGFCSMVSGAVGCGHATGTYGGNIGAISATRVASRSVFLCTGILYILFGVFGKFSAIFITIPYPVLGGAIFVMLGVCLGVVVSNLEVVDMSSSRNIAIFGLAVFIGLCVPTWAQRVKNPVDTGNQTFDRIMAMLLGNPHLAGTIAACFLDNTVPGTPEERGISAWQVSEDDETAEVDPEKFDEGYTLYEPLLPQRWLRSPWMKYIPFLPYKRPTSGAHKSV
ncbi:solute carrier family 23 member 1-like [Mya arenaria]|uniref:solute carrier family 23 member 1-like n=1 Tax=Mya arenaria TaxID=6604 RepID=UPI0022E987A3|nr:solute carrier family 23 member 1-like [Mya arenaria]